MTTTTPRKTLIGLVGMPGSGKGTIAKIFQEELGANRVTRCSSGQLLVEVANLLNLVPGRENLQRLPVAIDKEFGRGTFSKAMDKRLAAQKTEVVMWDGVRWKTDQEIIRRNTRNYIIYVTAPPEVRFERLNKRGEKPGEIEMTWEQFLREDKAPTEVEVEKIGATADWIIHNDQRCSLEDLRTMVQRFCKKL